MEIRNARRKSFDVSYVIVTEENIEEVATWCGGEVGGEGAERYVKVTDKNAISTRQAKAFVDDYVLKMSETGSSFKAFTEKAFKKSYESIVASGEKKIARSAKSGQFVSHEEAEANPDTTVVEQVTEYGVTRRVSKAELDEAIASLGEPKKVILKGVDIEGDTQIVLPDTNAEPKDPEDVEWNDETTKEK